MATASARTSYICLTNSSLNSLPRTLCTGPATTRWKAQFKPRVAVRYFQLATDPLERQDKKAPLTPTVSRGASKLFKDADEAVADLKSGSIILSSGFGLCGTAGTTKSQV
jgi:3-oxoacid CoA-transferase